MKKKIIDNDRTSKNIKNNIYLKFYNVDITFGNHELKKYLSY